MAIIADKERFAAFLFYIEDWLSSTAIDLMTAAEERGYLRILLHSWKDADCSLPDDDRVLAHLSRLGPAWDAGSGSVVRAQFFTKDGRIYNERLLKERENQKAKRIARSGAGKAGAYSRWDSRRITQPLADECQADSKPMANAWQTDSKPDGKMMQAQAQAQSTSTNNIKTICSSDDERGESVLELTSQESKPVDAVKLWFDTEFWPAYPRKTAKPQALKAARFHGKTATDRAAILECLLRRLPAIQTQFRTDGDYRPYPASWLNQQPWSDPEDTAQPAGAKHSGGIGSAIEQAMQIMKSEGDD